MTSRKLFIVDSVAAARTLLSRGTFESGDDIFSTHYSVVGFLAAKGITCRDFSDFIGIDEARTAIQSASSELDATLERLDGTLGVRMCAVAGLPRMALFHALFKYLGQYHLAGLTSFESNLSTRLAQGDISIVLFYHALPNSSDPIFSFVDAMARVCKANYVEYAGISCAHSAAARLVGEIFRLGRLGQRALQSPKKAITVLIRRLCRVRWSTQRISGASPTALILDPGEASFFEAALSRRGMQIIRVPRNGIVPVGGISLSDARGMLRKMVTAAVEWKQTELAVTSSDLDRRFVSSVIENASSLLLPVAHAHLILKSHAISAVTWDVPLVTRPQLNLLAELFLRSGVSVLGRQHGANYVHQDLGTIHFDSDFNRCTHFFTYGFGPQEFAATYPNVKPPCVFIPAGNAPLTVKSSVREIDIVFPITSCLSLFYFARLPESELARRQSKILQAMEERQGLSCVLKPTPDFNEDNFAHMELLKSLRNTKVFRASWVRFLQAWRPQLVVFEMASTPLFETLPLDVDIFLMLDPVFPFSESALAMLKKRVHVFSAVKELSDAIRNYGGADEGPGLRDDEFYRTYVNRGSIDTAFSEFDAFASTERASKVSANARVAKPWRN